MSWAALRADGSRERPDAPALLAASRVPVGPMIGDPDAATIDVEAREHLRRRRVVTQHDLDTLYKRPSLPIEIRYAHLLTVMFMSLFYSSGLPLMTALAAVSFMAS